MNAPTVAPEIRQEAARSLLERASEKLALVRFFRYNASAKHGVPIDSPREYDLSSRTETTTTTTTDRPNNGVTVIDDKTDQGKTGTSVDVGQTPPNISVNVAPSPPAPAAPVSSGNDIFKGVLWTLFALIGLGGALAIGYALAGPGESSNQNQTQAPPATTTTTQEQQTEKQIVQSPLQFLEDVGAHLPENVDE